MEDSAETKRLSEKQERLLELIKKKKECDKRAQDIVLRLIEQNVTEQFLLDNAFHVNPGHFEDVIEERKLSGVCGWVLCDLSLEVGSTGGTQSSKKKGNNSPQYSIRGQRVLDVRQRRNFCSSKCYAKAYHFKRQLLTSPLYLRDQDALELEARFEVLKDDSELHGLAVNLTGLKLDEEDLKAKKKDGGGDPDESSSTSTEED